MIKTLLAGAALTVLVGCAAPITHERLRDAAYIDSYINACYRDKNLSSMEAAQARDAFRISLARYGITPQSIRPYMGEANRRNVTLTSAVDCKQILVSYTRNAANIAAENQREQQIIDSYIHNNRRTQTNCFNLGGMISCNSF